MRTALGVLAELANWLLATVVPQPEPIPGPPPYAIPAADWDMAVGAVCTRTGAHRAAAGQGLTDALQILDVLMAADEALADVQL